jgi:hypothetical protein
MAVNLSLPALVTIVSVQPGYVLTPTYIDLENESHMGQIVTFGGAPGVEAPAPLSPTNLSPLANPGAAPTLAASSGGHMAAGTYRYSYAGYRGTTSQVSAPSPTADITVSANQKVTVTHATITGADGYLIYREKL